MTEEYYCANCNQKLSKDEKPCPNCGSEKRNIHLELFEIISVSDRLNLHLKSDTKRDDGKPMKEIKSRIENNTDTTIYKGRKDNNTIILHMFRKNGELTHFEDKTQNLILKQIDGNLYNDKDGNIYLRKTSKDNISIEIFIDSDGKEYKFIME